MNMGSFGIELVLIVTSRLGEVKSFFSYVIGT